MPIYSSLAELAPETLKKQKVFIPDAGWAVQYLDQTVESSSDKMEFYFSDCRKLFDFHI